MLTRENIEVVPERIRPFMRADGGFRAAAQPPTSALDDALPRGPAPISLDARLGELEASLITWALEACEGNTSRAAELLQIKRSTLQDRIKRHQLDPGSELRAVPSDLAAST